MSAGKRLLQHWAGIGWGLLILVFTGIPGQMIPKVSGFLDLFAPDKLVHLFLFGLFSVALMKGFLKDESPGSRSGWIYAFIIGVLMGAMTEILQWKVFINREGSVWDFIADVAGSALGMLVAWRWKRILFETRAKRKDS